jgi:hypothetical protein
MRISNRRNRIITANKLWQSPAPVERFSCEKATQETRTANQLNIHAQTNNAPDRSQNFNIDYNE